MGTRGWDGRKDARCCLTPMGPMPGPPPPWGMQKVLCRFRWHTSAPMCPGDVRPTCGGGPRAPPPPACGPHLPCFVGAMTASDRHAIWQAWSADPAMDPVQGREEGGGKVQGLT